MDGTKLEINGIDATADLITEGDGMYLAPEDRVAIEQAAQAHFDTQMDEFLTLLRAAARAVTNWRM